MVKTVEEFTDEELQDIGEWVVEYWNQFGEDEQIPGADLVEELGWRLVRASRENEGGVSAETEVEAIIVGSLCDVRADEELFGEEATEEAEAPVSVVVEDETPAGLRLDLGNREILIEHQSGSLVIFVHEVGGDTVDERIEFDL